MSLLAHTHTHTHTHTHRGWGVVFKVLSCLTNISDMFICSTDCQAYSMTTNFIWWIGAKITARSAVCRDEWIHVDFLRRRPSLGSWGLPGTSVGDQADGSAAGTGDQDAAGRTTHLQGPWLGRRGSHGTAAPWTFFFFFFFAFCL